MVNKHLVKSLDGNYSATILLSDLIQRREYFASRESLSEDGSFYVLSETIEKDLCMGAQMRRRASKDLQEKGFLKIVTKKTSIPSKGIQSVNFYVINDKAVIDALSGRGLQNVTTGVTNHDHGGYKTGTQIRIKEIRIKENRKREISQEDVYRKWLSEISSTPVYQKCYEELLVLFESLKSCEILPDDLLPSFKKKVLSRWSKSKYPERQIEMWDKAFGATFNSDIELSVPEVKEPQGVKTKSFDGQITIDTAIKMLSPDDEIEKMMQEYEEIKKRDRVDVFDDEEC
jgi:hypothetical protein